MGPDRCAGSRRGARGRRLPGLLQTAVLFWHRHGVRWSSQFSRMCWGHGVRGARSQGGQQGGQGGQSRGDGPLMCCTATPGGTSHASSLCPGAAAWPAAWGGGALGVRGMPRGSACPAPENVGGRLFVFRWGGSVHRMPRQVFQHRPACVVLVRT